MMCSVLSMFTFSHPRMKHVLLRQQLLLKLLVSFLALLPLSAISVTNSEPETVWDIDRNGSQDALTDGVLILRYLFGITGESLIDGAIGNSASNTTAVSIENELAQRISANTLDIDFNGTNDALTDGVLVLRYLFGFSGQSLLDNSIGDNSKRDCVAGIESFLLDGIFNSSNTITVNQPLDALSSFNYPITQAFCATPTVSGSWLSYDDATQSLTGTPSFTLSGSTSSVTVLLSNGSTLVINVDIAEPEITNRAALRLIEQATFGGDMASMNSIKTQGITSWVDAQLNMSSAYDSSTDTWQTHLERTIQSITTANPSVDYFVSDNVFNKQPADVRSPRYQLAAWFDNALGNADISPQVGTDSIRQRMAYALSQLMVVSDTATPLDRRGGALANYYDLLTRNALGNFRDLLGEMARSPAMGVYLSHQGNRKTDLEANTLPDENFAREVMQLFTVGLSELNLDGSPNRDGDSATYPDSGDNLVPTYTQNDVSELAKIMTGWDLQSNNRYGDARNTQGDYTVPMEFTASEHEDEVSLNGDGMVTILGQTISLTSGDDQSGMDAALDILFNHPNVAPYVSRHLIQRFVTSNPSGEYVARVATVFNGIGNERGDLKAVIRAILLDDEARSIAISQQDNYGKVKEPLLAMMQLFKAIGVEPLDGWRTREDVLLNNTYWYHNPRNDIAQGPLRSPSVFNFYSPDFVPSDSHFNNNRLLAPEAQLYTDQVIINMHNRVQSLLSGYERNRIEQTRTLADYAATRTSNTSAIFLLDYSDELQLMETALENDSNGDFLDINNNTIDEQGSSPRQRMISALLDYVDTLLLGDTMDDKYRAAITHYLVDGRGINNANPEIEATNIVLDTYRYIFTSGTYLVQK